MNSTVLVSWTDALMRALAPRGVDTAGLAAASGIDASALADPDRRLPIEASTRLWRHAVEVTGDDALGLDVARFTRPATFHALGQAVLSSATWADALDRIARFSQVTADAAVVSTGRCDDRMLLRVEPRRGHPAPAPESIDAIFATIVRTGRWLLGRGADPLEVHLSRPEPRSVAAFAACFRCEVRYGSPSNLLVYDRRLTEGPVAGGNAALARLTDEVMARYLAGLTPTGAVDRTRRAVLELLPGRSPTVTAVARTQNTSARSLQRELAADGTTFREVLAAVRRELAEGYLLDGGLSVTEIAFLLGYRETATFSRSFKEWTGVPPSAFGASARPVAQRPCSM